MNKLLRMLRQRMYYRAFIDPRDEREVVTRFHRLYYDLHQFGRTWKQTSWLGAPALKCPLDLWIYQEIMAEVRPHLVVETGTAGGGSALFLASICDLLGHGRVVTIDVADAPGRPRHSRITYVQGSSVDPAVVEGVRRQIAPEDRVLVILDSDHRRDHVLAELRAYGPLVTRGSYLVVEDSNLNGHPVHPEHGPGPTEAMEIFLAESRVFEVDREREKFLLTFNPGGYLRRVG